jgi:hypothetical protein
LPAGAVASFSYGHLKQHAEKVADHVSLTPAAASDQRTLNVRFPSGIFIGCTNRVV